MERADQDRDISEKRVTRRNFLKRMVGLAGDGEDASLLDTAKLSTVFTLGVIATIPPVAEVVKGTDFNPGNAGSSEIFRELRKNPAQGYLAASILGPLLEVCGRNVFLENGKR